MKQFDLKKFLDICVKTVPSFEKDELKEYPQNEFILKSAIQINKEFKDALDIARLEVGLVPNEVYISKWSDGTSTANLGSTLLGRRVVFSERITEKIKNKGISFLFELEFFKRYQSCVRLRENIEQEISEAYNARDVPVAERASVLAALEEEYRARYVLLRILSKKKYATNEKEEIQRNLNHLDVLISKLKRIHKGHY